MPVSTGLCFIMLRYRGFMNRNQQTRSSDLSGAETTSGSLQVNVEPLKVQFTQITKDLFLSTLPSLYVHGFDFTFRSWKISNQMELLFVALEELKN